MEYYLENEFLSLTFNSVGGTLSSIKSPLGIEYLWQGNPEYWSGQAPVLFPICGSLRNDEAITKDGKELHIPRHGLVRKRDFHYEGQEWNRIVFSIMTDDELFKAFPYKFRLLIEYKLMGKLIQVSYIIENFGDDDMPFFIGGHPGFNCPLQENENYTDYYIEFEKEENCSIPLPITETGLIDIQQRTPLLHHEKVLPLVHSLFEKDAIIFDELQSRQVTLASHKSSHKVTIQFKDFPYFILWSSQNHGSFIALEPWLRLSTCLNESDIFEEKKNVQIVQSLRTNIYSYSIQID